MQNSCLIRGRFTGHNTTVIGRYHHRHVRLYSNIQITRTRVSWDTWPATSKAERSRLHRGRGLDTGIRQVPTAAAAAAARMTADNAP